MAPLGTAGALDNMHEEIIRLVPALLLLTTRLGFDNVVATGNRKGTCHELFDKTCAAAGCRSDGSGWLRERQGQWTTTGLHLVAHAGYTHHHSGSERHDERGYRPQQFHRRDHFGLEWRASRNQRILGPIR